MGQYRKRWGNKGPGQYDFGPNYKPGLLPSPRSGTAAYPNLPPRTGMAMKLRWAVGWVLLDAAFLCEQEWWRSPLPLATPICHASSRAHARTAA
jgi:hypothetical protein